MKHLTLACAVMALTSVDPPVDAQSSLPCVARPFQAAAHADIRSDDRGLAHGSFPIQLPNLATQIQQVSVRIDGSSDRAVVDVRNLTAVIQLTSVSVEHGVDIPTNPFAAGNLFPASFSREVTFYADANSVAKFEADFGASAAQILRGVDLSIVGLARSAGCGPQ